MVWFLEIEESSHTPKLPSLNSHPQTTAGYRQQKPCSQNEQGLLCALVPTACPPSIFSAGHHNRGNIRSACGSNGTAPCCQRATVSAGADRSKKPFPVRARPSKREAWPGSRPLPPSAVSGKR